MAVELTRQKFPAVQFAMVEGLVQKLPAGQVPCALEPAAQ